MKKILILCTLILFVFLFASEAEKEENRASELIDNVVQSRTGDLDRMLKDRVIRVLVSPSKIMFDIDKGKKSGFFYELLMQFEKEINAHYPPKNKHLKTRVVFIPVSKDQLIPWLLEGRGDIAVGDISITPKRKLKIDFSDPFASKINAIVVSGPSSPELNTLADLSGKEVYVHDSSSYREYLETTNFHLAEAGMEAIKIKSIPEALDGEEVLEILNAGLIPITVKDEYQAKFWSQVFTDITLHPDMILKENDEFAWMMRKNSPKLKSEVNTFIKKHKEGTTLGNTLIKRYIVNYKFEKPDISKKSLESFEKVVGIFKKYAKEYDLSYRLMIAQGYQESKLEQKTKSKAGAIGIMQLMPETGKSMNVGNINETEANIHAGIKYHRYIIDRYFKEYGMDKKNQTLFAFAAYNAGPARIAKLRKIAKEKGYDPNVWFNNVEIIAAEKIGAETVSYVSNIYEYYVAYTLYEEKREAKEEIKKKAISTGKL